MSSTKRNHGADQESRLRDALTKAVVEIVMAIPPRSGDGPLEEPDAPKCNSRQRHVHAALDALREAERLAA